MYEDVEADDLDWPSSGIGARVGQLEQCLTCSNPDCRRQRPSARPPAVPAQTDLCPVASGAAEKQTLIFDFTIEKLKNP